MNKIKEKAKNIGDYIENITRQQFKKEINLFKLIPVVCFISIVTDAYKVFIEAGLIEEGITFLFSIIVLLLMVKTVREMEQQCVKEGK